MTFLQTLALSLASGFLAAIIVLVLRDVLRWLHGKVYPNAR